MPNDIVFFDRSARTRVAIAGAAATDTVNGLVTNDVKALVAGQGLYAVAPSSKGKIVADVRIFRRNADLLADCDPSCAEGWLGIMRKYVNPRFASWRDVTTADASLGVVGATAEHALAAVLGVSADTIAILPDYGFLTAGSVMVIRAPEVSHPCFDLIGPPGEVAALRAALEAGGARPGAQSEWEAWRIEAGRPRWGVDMDENTLPQEARMDELGAISYQKGCYTGQEVIARLHFRGHTNRRLCGLRLRRAVPPGTALVSADLAQVGDVRSGAHSERFGDVALGMIRREIPFGTRLIAQIPDDPIDALVVDLPFA